MKQREMANEIEKSEGRKEGKQRERQNEERAQWRTLKSWMLMSERKREEKQERQRSGEGE